MSIWDALQGALTQETETRERTAQVSLHDGAVDRIDPPSAIDEYYHDLYEEVGIIRASLNQYVSDVFEPGVRVNADSDETEEWFQDEFLPNCGVIGGERHRSFESFAPRTEIQRLVRGTALVELLKADRETVIPETEITGFYHIPPETVTALPEPRKNILTAPDADGDDLPMTARGEAAAYAQFDDQSILGRRRGGFDRETVYLSQTDVRKATFDLDIGGDGSDETGIFGTSILEAVAEEAEEYKQIKRDRATAIKTKAYGIWLANFTTEVLELPNDQVEIQEWDDSSIDAVTSELEGMGPGDILELEGPVELDQWESDVPDLDATLRHLVDDILAPLPAPKYAVGFETDINQFVTEQQETRYDQVVREGRQYQEQFWTGIFRTVAESHDLDPSGLEVLIQPEEDESPVRSLSPEEIEQVKAYAEALDLLAGPTAGPGTLVDDATLRELIAQLPDDAEPAEEPPLDESDEEVEAQFAAAFAENGGGGID